MLETLTLAARARHYAGARDSAARLSELAARRALDIGEVYTAAVSLRNAAHHYAAVGKSIRSQELAWRSCKLSNASSLNANEREEIASWFSNCSTRLERLATRR